MYFCNTNHETMQVNRRKNNEITGQKLTACWWKYKSIKDFRFEKVLWSNIFKSHRVGERPYGLTAQPALLLAEINFKLKTFHM